MFQSVRVQMIQPCRAKCAWCSTHKKNPRFQAIVDRDEAKDFHGFYKKVIEEQQPREVFVSGGEPLLSDDIEEFLDSISPHAQVVHVFTSYQFSRGVMERIANYDFPENVVLNHTTIYFEPERWLKLTGFPFDVYADNVRRASKLKVKKRFKFIINHDKFDEEIRRFQELIEPDETCEISLKVMNDQGNGQVVDTLTKTADRVHERVEALDELLEEAGWSQDRPKTSADRVKDVIRLGDTTICPYRDEPLELRLAFYKGEDGKQVLKYRYCPFFPPDFGHKFHLGRDDIGKLEKNFKRGEFKKHCGGCRLLHYQT